MMADLSSDQGNTIKPELPPAKVVERFNRDNYDTGPDSSPARCGQDQVNLSFSDRCTGLGFLRDFLVGIENDRFSQVKDEELLLLAIKVISYKGNRCQVLDHTNHGGQFEVRIFGNWTALTPQAKLWLKSHTQLDGSLD